jgi:hypothetical protein
MKASDLLEQVVARAPNYAPAWSMLALAYVLTPNYHWAFFISENDHYSWMSFPAKGGRPPKVPIVC